MTGDIDDVVIVGAGPTGLMLAGELALAGVRPTILEQLPEPATTPKANGLVGQIVRLLDYRGLLPRFAEGAPFVGPTPQFQFGPLRLDLARIEGGSPLLLLPIQQRRLERLLTERVLTLGARIDRGHEVIGCAEDEQAVTLDVRTSEGEHQRRARYVVGCDGGRGTIRKLAGIEFPGYTSDVLTRIGRVTLPGARALSAGEADVPGFGRLALFRTVNTATGGYTAARLSQLDSSAGPDVYIVSTHETGTEPDTPMTLAELRDSVRRVLGADLPMTDPQWLTRTVGNSRLAEQFRSGRVFLAGDCAHLFAAGGSGLNAGMLDAVNLAWKLAADLHGWAPSSLLNTYHTERHAAGERTLLHTRAQAALADSGMKTEALRALITELTGYQEPLRHIGDMLQGNDIRYPMPGPAHPLLGSFAQHLPAELMHRARPVLVDRIGKAAEISADWQDRVDIVVTPEPGEPAAMLVRPDCHVAWARDDDTTEGLPEALRTWFG